MIEVKCQSNDNIKIMMVLIDLHIGVTYGETNGERIQYCAAERDIVCNDAGGKVCDSSERQKLKPPRE